MKKENFKKILISLGLSAVVGTTGFVTTHEKIGDNWITNGEYSELRQRLFIKQENNPLTYDEYLLLVDVYNNEIKKNGKLKLNNVDKTNIFSEIHKKFKPQKPEKLKNIKK